MVEQFRAEIDINGDPSGAIAAIKAVENAYDKLGNKNVTVGVRTEKARMALADIKEHIDQAGSSAKTFDKQLRSASNATAFRNISAEATKARSSIQKINESLAETLNSNTIPDNVRRQIVQFRDTIDSLDRSFAETASRATAKGTQFDGAIRRADKATSDLVKKQAKLQDIMGQSAKGADNFRNSIRGTGLEFEKAIRKAAVYEGKLAWLDKIPTGSRTGDWNIQRAEALDKLNAATTRQIDLAKEYVDLESRAAAENAKIRDKHHKEFQRAEASADKERLRRKDQISKMEMDLADGVAKAEAASLKDRVAAQDRLNKSLGNYDKVLSSTSNKANTVHRNLRAQSAAYAELSDSINDLTRKERSLSKRAETGPTNLAADRELIRTRAALADAIDQRTELTQELFKHNAALDKNAEAQAKSARAVAQSNAAMGDTTPIEKRNRAVRELADAEAKLTKLTKDLNNAQAAVKDSDTIQNRRKLVDADIAYTEALKARDAAQKAVNVSSRQAIDYDLKQAAAYNDALDQRNRALSQARRNEELLQRYQTMEQYPGSYGERLAAEMGRTSALNEMKEAEADLTRARQASAAAAASYGIGSSQATAAMRTEAAAARDLTSAKYRLAEAQQSYNNANMLNGNAARYAMYDAAQYQMMAGLAMMAPAALGGLAFGKYESMFSDVQRTVGIDGMGILEDGSSALNLFDGMTTSSDRAFKSLLNVGRQMPVAYSDIFDMAAKAGSIGATGVKDMERLVNSVARFNVVSDTSNAADTMESFGQISNLMVDKKYDSIASSIVNAGVAAAATDDQIIKMSKELSMSAAGANFATEEIIGLGTGFASLAIPPERARSVFQNLVTTMSKGMSQTTPEIKNMAKLLNTSVDSVRDLWKADPTRLFMQMTQALGGMEETRMVDVLEGIGLEGQRAVPMFQAIAKNVRESSDGMDILSTSLAAAVEGYENTDILTEAVNAKTDDLAGKWQMLVNEAMTFGTLIGAAVDSIGGFTVLDVLSNILKGLNSIVELPFVGQLVGAAATLAGILGTIRAISGASMFLQAGRMALANMSGMNLAGTRAGNLGYLMFGREPGTPRGTTGGTTQTRGGVGVIPGLVTADTARTTREQEAATRRYITAMDRATNQFVAQGKWMTAASTSGQMIPRAMTTLSTASMNAGIVLSNFKDRVVTGTKAFGRQLHGFVGGGLGWASLGIGAALAGAGILAETTTKRAEKADTAWVQRLQDTHLRYDDDGVYQGSAQLGTIFSDFSQNIQDGLSWTDKINLRNPLEASSGVTGVLAGLANTPGGLAQYAKATRERSQTPWWQSYNWSEYNGMAVDDVKKADVAMLEFGQNLSELPFEAQLDIVSKLQNQMGLTNDNMGDAIKRLGPEFYDSFIGGLNEAMGTTTGLEFNEKNLLEAGLSVDEAWRNYQLSSGTSYTTPGISYDDMLGESHRNSVLAGYRDIAAATDAAMGAEFAYHNAISAGTEWMNEYGSVVRDNAGAIDYSVASNQELYGIQSSLAASTLDRIATMKEENATLGEISQIANEGYEAFMEMGLAAGMSSEEVAALAENLGLMPDQIVSDIITEHINAGDMTLEQLMDTLMALPEGETVTVQADALTDEALAALEAFGFKIETLPDGTIKIHALTDEAKEALEGLVSFEGDTIVFEVGAVGAEEVQAQLDILGESGGHLDFGVNVDAAGKAALEELGVTFHQIRNADGTVTTRVIIPEGMGAAKIQEIIDTIAALEGKDVEVNVKFNYEGTDGSGKPISDDAWEYGWDDAERWGVEKPFSRLDGANSSVSVDVGSSYRSKGKINRYGSGGKGDDSGSILGPNGYTPGFATITPMVNTDPATGEVISWSQGVTDGTLTPIPNPFIYANANPATNAANTWAGMASRLNPISAIFGNNQPAMGSSLGWAGYTMGLNPMASMFANANPAAATSLGWMAMAMGLSPMSIQSANAAPALATSLGWWALAMGLSPMSIQRANAAPALATALSWYARVSSMSPVATIRAVALTGGAESVLNYTARPRTTTITAYVQTVGSPNRLKAGNYWTGGYTGRGGKYEPAGIVHRGEYVIPKKDVDQSTGLPNLNALGRIYEGQAAPLNLSALSGSNRGGQASGVVDLGAGTIHAIAQAVQTQLALDGKVVASSASNHFRKGTRRGSN